MRGDEGVDLRRDLWRERGRATNAEVCVGVNALEDRREHAAGLICHVHLVVKELRTPPGIAA